MLLISWPVLWGGWRKEWAAPAGPAGTGAAWERGGGFSREPVGSWNIRRMGKLFPGSAGQVHLGMRESMGAWFLEEGLEGSETGHKSREDMGGAEKGRQWYKREAR